MKIADYLETLRREGVLLREAAERAGLDAAVPTCPGWHVREVLAHTGGVHRWVTSIVAGPRTKPPGQDENALLFAAPEDDALLDWFREAHSTLVRTLGEADPGVTCWSFLPAPSPLAFWTRRQAHETTMHRVDAEASGGGCTQCAPAFAADGIDELLAGFLARPHGRLVADPPVSLSLRATDADVAWTVFIEADRRRILPEARTADLTITGPAHGLYLLLWNRDGTEDLDVLGDPAVLQLWRDRATL
ncbi:MAG: maleylpyruvate isomerase family mycothiol-dependent enzyme [Dactylosporangium sp.]|nr:maleylpyruvate isomerase family mycothiol-dependent enzyme [Dactylosporangium sp.]NNJ62432.1 maleylpyruvate isomerase family mycothiol-dependent enzyme [Dactylosporangium sp.]